MVHQEPLSWCQVASKVKWFVSMTFVGFLFILMKGGKKIESILGIERCSTPYFGVLVAMGVVFLLFFRQIRKSQVEEHGYSGEDVEVLNRNGRNGLITGIIGGLIGIGGGMILTAEWLQLGLHP